ncbi:DUF6624 domain-containing protein [Glaciecola sp. 1036]|uniref:DUF6624 domain-containing protein n=1 Tax=Alteromonadaceae TaxID=72275 RepID=UPI003D03616E
MRYLFILTLLSFQSFAAIDLNLQNELQEMANADQQVRESIGKIGWDNPPEDLVSQMREIDAGNTQRLKKIIKQHSWLAAVIGV